MKPRKTTSESSKELKVALDKLFNTLAEELHLYKLCSLLERFLNKLIDCVRKRK